jgi:hypothetical protein
MHINLYQAEFSNFNQKNLNHVKKFEAEHRLKVNAMHCHKVIKQTQILKAKFAASNASHFSLLHERKFSSKLSSSHLAQAATGNLLES